KFDLKNWYLRDKDNYTGIHVYFKNKSNHYYPWELQIWDEKDVDQNIESHKLFKRHFV
ncbi:TPA: GTP pyrophosphokinase, partial [Streptococcus agalactiae]|nr:GTP pyrophosphokinase [Streptococcus agalactiae]HEO1918090.1 GTP pyrophosphokinase [Streptococcus agalactiae]